jgi:hypothetical protein
MPTSHQPPARSGPATAYEIKVEGVVSERWTDWFTGLTLTLERPVQGPPVTTLSGRVPDQAALRGIVNKLWDMNLTLISVRPLAAEPLLEASHDH